MKNIFLKTALCAALATTFVGCGSDSDSSGTPAAKPAFELQLLHFADMDSSGAQVLNNVQNFSAVLDAFRKKMPNNTLVLSSGDNYIPGPRYAAAKEDEFKNVSGVATPGVARADIALLNAMGLQASAVGNHDLDGGTEEFAEIIKTDGSYAGAKFPYLSQNLDFTPDSNLKDLVQQNGKDLSTLGSGALAGYGTLIVNGEKIGVIGASTPTLNEITSTGDITVKGTEVAKKLAAEIQPAADALMKSGVNKIILLAHMQTISVEKALAKELKGVDIIVAGGSNTLLSDSNDKLRNGDTSEGDYPIKDTSASNEPILVVNTDSDYKYLGRLVVGFDDKGVILLDNLDDTVNGAYAATAETVAELKATVIPEVAVIQGSLTNVLKRLDGNVQGKSSVYLEGLRSFVRSEETNLGNLTADANLWLAKQYDANVKVSIKNGGGIRDKIGSAVVPAGSNSSDLVKSANEANASIGKEAGGISQLDIQNALKFNNSLVVADITAQELYDIIEHGVARVEDTKGQFPQVAGIKFSFDPSKNARQADGKTVTQKGERVRNLAIVDDAGKVTDTIVKDGVLQGDANRTIRMVTLGFLASDNDGVGGDGFPFQFPLENLMELKKLDEKGPKKSDFSDAGREQDALGEYLQEFHKTTAFNKADTPKAQDERIQNLSARADTVLK